MVKKMIFMLVFTAFFNFALIFLVSFYAGDEIYANGTLELMKDNPLESDVIIPQDTGSSESENYSTDFNTRQNTGVDDQAEFGGVSYDELTTEFFSSIIKGDYYTDDDFVLHFYEDGTYTGYFNGILTYVVGATYSVSSEGLLTLCFEDSVQEYMIDDSDIFLVLTDPDTGVSLDIYRR